MSKTRVRIGSLVRYKYPNWDIGIVIDIKVSPKKNKEPMMKVYWPDTEEEVWMSPLLLDIVSC